MVVDAMEEAMMTEASDDIHEFIRYFRSLRGDAAANAREGATTAEIEEFVRAARVPLPPLYLGYLKEFGHRDGALKLGDDASCDVRAVLDYLREQQGGDRPPVPAGCVLISVRGVSLSRALDYSEGGTEPHVVMNDMDEIIQYQASSFRIHLYRQAWFGRWFHPPGAVSMSQKGLRLLCEAPPFSEGLGFAPRWFNDRYRYCAERGAARLYMQTSFGRVTLRLCSPDRAELIELQTRFKRTFDLQG